MKVAVYGAGAMGTTLGAFLNESGVETHLITRNNAHIQTLKDKGAQVVCSADNRTIEVPVPALSCEEVKEKYDLVFLMTKQRDNEKTAHTLKGLLSENGVVCTTQNGLPEEGLISVLGEEKVLGAVCTFGANFLEAGKVELTSKIQSMRVEIGSLSTNAEAVERVYSLLKKVGQRFDNPSFANKAENLASVRWNKLSINAAFSTLSVVTGMTFGEIAKKRRTASLALRILRECFAVQRALNIPRVKTHGHDLEKFFGARNPFARFFLPLAVKNHKHLLSGTLADIKKGRKCEVDLVAGKVTEKARAVDVETPVIAQAVAIVHGIENGLYEITPENTAFF